VNGRYRDYHECVAMPYNIKSLSAVSVFLLALMSTNAAPTDPGRTAPIPALQRVKIVGNKAWGFDFAGSRGPRVPRLMEIRERPADAGGKYAEFYYIFASTQGANEPDAPLRCDMAASVLFCAFQMPRMHQPTGPLILRYPVEMLLAGPDDGRSSLDQAKMGGRYNSPDGAPPPNYVGCGPVGQALQGFHREWKEGKGRVGEPARAVHYDVRALDDARVEMFLTADGVHPKSRGDYAARWSGRESQKSSHW